MGEIRISIISKNLGFPCPVCKKKIYHKSPKYSDTLKIAAVTLRFEQCGSTIEK